MKKYQLTPFGRAELARKLKAKQKPTVSTAFQTTYNLETLTDEQAAKFLKQGGGQHVELAPIPKEPVKEAPKAPPTPFSKTSQTGKN